jgi:hypothetical protein
MELLTKIHEGIIYTEEWKPIQGYEDMYEVSSFGRVKSLRINKAIKSSNSGTYLKIELNVNGVSKKKYIHKLVAIAFLGHKPCGYEEVVDHINGDVLDNNIYNLQLITHRQNISKSKRFKRELPLGVKTVKSKFQSAVYVNGKTVSLGSFDSKEEASTAYKNALDSIKNNEEIAVKRRETSSKYKNIYFCKTRLKWMASFKRKHIGIYENEEDAYLTREEYIKQTINK